jgi:hypothetical protein
MQSSKDLKHRSTMIAMCGTKVRRLTRRRVLSRLEEHLRDCHEDELGALGEVFHTMTVAFADGIRVELTDDGCCLEIAISRDGEVSAAGDPSVDGPVIDFAHSLFKNLSLNPLTLMDDWDECAGVTGPNGFVVPLRHV